MPGLKTQLLVRSTMLFALLLSATLATALQFRAAPELVLQDEPSPTCDAPRWAITPAPPAEHVKMMLAKRQQTSFIGFFSWYGSWVSQTCPPDKFFAADPTYGVCCPLDGGPCPIGTACGGPNNNWALAAGGASGDCGAEKTCDTITLLRATPDVDPRRMILCLPVTDLFAIPKTWYRATFPLTTEVPTPSTRTRTRTQILEDTVTQTLRITVTPTPTPTPTSDSGGLSGLGPDQPGMGSVSLPSWISAVVFFATFAIMVML